MIIDSSPSIVELERALPPSATSTGNWQLVWICFGGGRLLLSLSYRSSISKLKVEWKGHGNIVMMYIRQSGWVVGGLDILSMGSFRRTFTNDSAVRLCAMCDMRPAAAFSFTPKIVMMTIYLDTTIRIIHFHLSSGLRIIRSGCKVVTC